MVAEYHLACVTRGSPVTSPILPGELKEHLPPLAGYLPPEDHTGTTDVRVRDNWARTLCMAMWCHRLDMAVSDPNSSWPLIRACHQMGVLFVYFLGPGTAWRLTFKDVVAQVLKENRQQLDTRRDEAVTSLHRCNQRWASLHREIDASAVAQELTANTPEGRELAVKLMALQTALGAMEKAMMAHEMQEEEAHQTFHEEPEEELLDEEMVEDDDRDDPEPSGPRAEAGKEDPPPPLEEANPAPPEPQSDVITPEEDALLMQPALLSRGPDAGSHSPRSEAGTASGELAGLSIASPGPTEPVGDETSQQGPPFHGSLSLQYEAPS